MVGQFAENHVNLQLYNVHAVASKTYEAVKSYIMCTHAFYVTLFMHFYGIRQIFMITRFQFCLQQVCNKLFQKRCVSHLMHFEVEFVLAEIMNFKLFSRMSSKVISFQPPC